MDDEGKEHKPDIAVPIFGYKNHASIDPRHGFIRGWTVAHAAAWDVARLRNVVRRSNTGLTVWADTAYRSQKNEAWLEKNGFVSDIHHKKRKGRPMSEVGRGPMADVQRSDPVSSTSLPPEIQNENICQDHQHRQSDDENRYGQSRLQHHPLRLA